MLSNDNGLAAHWWNKSMACCFKWVAAMIFIVFILFECFLEPDFTPDQD